MGELRKQTVSGVKWLVGTSIIHKFLGLATTVVLARILNPSTFGLYALAFVAIDALGLFKTLGFDAALIRTKKDIEKYANTAFLVIPFLGILIYFILAFSAPLVGKLLNNQEVIGVIKALGIIFVIGCFGRVPSALLEKNMQFKKVSIIEISSAIIYSLAAIILAFLKMGVWSLVIAYILKTLNSNILFWVFSKWHPYFEFDKKIAWEMFHFGKFLFLASIVGFLRMNLDNLLVGKLLGVTALGLYAIAFNVANFGADYFGVRIHRVTFPAYSKLQNDLDDLKSAFLRVLKHVSLFALPLGTVFLLLSKEFLVLVYGEKWVDAASILKILAWAGIFNALASGFDGIFLACGKPKLSFWITSLQVALFFIFIAPMAKLFGMNGVGIVVSISSIIAFIITLIWIKNMLSLNLNQIYLSLKPSLISTLFMGLGIIFLKKIILQYEIAIFTHFNFVILSISALMIYVFSLFKIEKLLFKEIKEIIF
jgi:PST family polysaccharide transporter